MELLIPDVVMAFVLLVKADKTAAAPKISSGKKIISICFKATTATTTVCASPALLPLPIKVTGSNLYRIATGLLATEQTPLALRCSPCFLSEIVRESPHDDFKFSTVHSSVEHQDWRRLYWLQ